MKYIIKYYNTKTHYNKTKKIICTNDIFLNEVILNDFDKFKNYMENVQDFTIWYEFIVDFFKVNEKYNTPFRLPNEPFKNKKVIYITERN